MRTGGEAGVEREDPPQALHPSGGSNVWRGPNAGDGGGDWEEPLGTKISTSTESPRPQGEELHQRHDPPAAVALGPRVAGVPFQRPWRERAAERQGHQHATHDAATEGSAPRSRRRAEPSARTGAEQCETPSPGRSPNSTRALRARRSRAGRPPRRSGWTRSTRRRPVSRPPAWNQSLAVERELHRPRGQRERNGNEANASTCRDRRYVPCEPSAFTAPWRTAPSAK